MTFSTTPVVTRQMRRQDAAAVVRMVRRLAAFHHDATSLKATFLLQHCFGREKYARVWVASVFDKVIGFVLVADRINFINAHIDSGMDLLFVEKRWRSKGIGKALVACAATDAISRKCQNLLTGRDLKNNGAGKFYSQLGFTQRPRKTDQYVIKGAALLQLSKK